MLACDRLLINAQTIDADGYLQTQQAIAIKDGLISWCGQEKDLPSVNAVSREDCNNQLITPGLIDCHTHLVYCGNRAHEFKQRLEGATYSDIARAGGGILSTVKQVRAASQEELIEQSLPRLLAMRAEGVTTVEVKSGYGLDLMNETKMLTVARHLGKLCGMRIKTTFLGAHAIPPEFANNTQGYVDYLCADVLPAMAELELVDAVDVFCEAIAFSYKQTEQLFLQAQALKLPIKCHAEQLSNLGASKLAAEMGALSCDHLEFLDEVGAKAMANQGTVAVLLPGAFYFLRGTKIPPIALLRKLGIGIAIATDCNPGSSPTTSLPLMMNMACQFFGLTVEEVLAGVTTKAAKALGIEQEVGAIGVGLAADLVRWSVNDSSILCYHFGYPLPHVTMIAGHWID
ncbi:imidazolone-5-propionate hydrolase [Legionella beliardensis]|uniref:Imidazolonepropionase n=1 Tax=Legionella beliardensis TaxID=91822 RepID=A0A378I3W6_9GAMM|nr:imidazolonepropionase [Legionella beliardensis]STX29552.1 imidazolone-5-propionate hydrolase [Legionella beliardensis]